MTITTKVKSFAAAHKPELVAVTIVTVAFAAAIVVAKTSPFYSKLAAAIEDDSVEIIPSADGKSFTIRDKS